MQLKQLIVVAGGVVLTFTLFLFGKTRFPEGQSKPSAAAVRDRGSVETSMTIEKLLSLASGTLSPADQKLIVSLNKQLSVAKTKKDSVDVMKGLSRAWMNSSNYIAAGSYYMDVAVRTNEISYWDSAAEFFNYGFHTTGDSSARYFAIDKALACYDKLRKTDPDNIDYKIGYANTLIDGKDDVMNAVALLREIDKKDPDNIQVNLILGKLNIRNGQLDKSLERLQKVIKLDPDNITAYLYLSDCYSAMGKKDKAIDALMQAKSISHDEETTKEIDQSIKERTH